MFVSSTCYDLKQIRTDIKDFVESLGIQPILSEYDFFPVNPDLNAIENCLKVVEDSADLFLLVVGGRYGSIIEQDKSVTNMEYLRARAKGIPIYVFVEKSIINILPVWKQNKEVEFKGVVDSPKLFEFVNSLMSIDGIWVFPFELAQDITRTLKKQLAYLFMDALQLRGRARSNGLSASLAQLHGKPLRLVIEQPPLWEAKLFANVLAQEISNVNQKRLDLDYGVTLGASDFLSDRESVFKWLEKKIEEARRIIHATNQIIEVAFQDAMAPIGTPASPEKLVYTAKRLAHAYENAMDWMIECSRVAIGDEEFKKLVRLTGKMLINMVTEVEEFSAKILTEIDTLTPSELKSGEEPKIINFTLKLTIPDDLELYEEMDRIKNLYETYE